MVDAPRTFRSDLVMTSSVLKLQSNMKVLSNTYLLLWYPHFKQILPFKDQITSKEKKTMGHYYWNDNWDLGLNWKFSKIHAYLSFNISRKHYYYYCYCYCYYYQFLNTYYLTLKSSCSCPIPSFGSLTCVRMQLFREEWWWGLDTEVEIQSR